MTMLNLARSFSFGCALLGLSACYTVEFDEQKADAYYCQTDDQCLATQACSQFRCVDDQGPQILISGPEPKPPGKFDVGAPFLDVSLDISDFMLDESSSVQDGFGKVLLAIDPHKASPISALIDTSSAQLSLGAGLDAGPHHLTAQAVFGDGTPYPNPSARAHTIFFSTEAESLGRPQVAILEPEPGHVHIADQPLDVRVINIGFNFVDNGADCHVPDNCDPFGPEDPNNPCLPAEMGCTDINKSGHVHIYMLADYPACLFDAPVNCNFEYLVTIRPGPGDPGDEVATVIEADSFPDAGEFMLTAALQYSNHLPYPNRDFIIFDQMPLTVIER